jgi:hypothetical protein
MWGKIIISLKGSRGTNFTWGFVGAGTLGVSMVFLYDRGFKALI